MAVRRERSWVENGRKRAGRRRMVLDERGRETGERWERRRMDRPGRSIERRYGPRGALEYVESILGRRVVERRRARAVRPMVHGHDVELACRRAMQDRRPDSPARKAGYRFNWARAAHFVEFVQQTCRHVEGELAGQLIRLQPWQVWIYSEVFGWEDAQERRRFGTVYQEVARKNAKSTMVAPVGLYLLAYDGEEGAQIYSAARVYSQAAIVWRIAKRMARRSEALASDIEPWAQSLTHPATGSIFQPLHAKALSQEGLNVHGALVDEFHAHPDDQMADVLRYGKAARRQPLIWYITTAGANRAGPCYAERDYARRVLLGTQDDPAYFAAIYTLDEGDDWTDPVNFLKANPNMDVAFRSEELHAELRFALGNPRKASEFQTKRLNRWVGAMASIFNVEAWNKLAAPELIPQLAGLPRVVRFDGADFASKRDLTAIVHLFRIEAEGTRTYRRRISRLTEEAVYEDVEVPLCWYFALPRLFVPQGAVEDPDNKNAAQYRAWIDAGWIEQTDGPIMDFEAAKDAVREGFGVDLIEVGLDPFQGAQFAREMAAEGVPMTEVRQTVLNMSEPTKELDALITAGLIKHDGNPAFAWMLGNVVGKIDKKDNIYPNKEFAENKIDGPIALIIALSRALGYEEVEPPSVMFI